MPNFCVTMCYFFLKKKSKTRKKTTSLSHLLVFYFPGLAYLCEGLKEQRKGLVTLVLWNNQLTHTGMAYMGMTLVSPNLLLYFGAELLIRKLET